MKRQIIEIDEDKCTGCGECIPQCQEGALQLIDGKARLVSDAFCDGLGACLGHCPEGAIRVVQREAEPYDERTVMAENIVPKGANTIRAHLQHLKEHGAEDLLREALQYLTDQGIQVPEYGERHQEAPPCACPGSAPASQDTSSTPLPNWPIQLQLMSPRAPHITDADLVLAADCTAFASADFHGSLLQGRTLTIACPKLDGKGEAYMQKLAEMMPSIRSMTVIIMEVPCCSGLLQLAKGAREMAETEIPIKRIVIGIDGTQQQEGWI